MVRAHQYRRLVFVVFLVALVFVCLAGRLYDVQVVQHASLQAKADDLHYETIFREPRRGDILDRCGIVLATSRPSVTVCADPTLIDPYQAAVARVVAPLLQVNGQELAARLCLRPYRDKRGRTNFYRYVVLRRQVTLETWQRVRAAMAGLAPAPSERLLTKRQQAFLTRLRRHAIFAEPGYVRVYPNQRLAAHVLGYVGVAAREAVLAERGRVRKRILETYGRDGIERTFNTALTGVRGWRVTEVDPLKHELVAFREDDVAPRPGLTVVLTIDATLQHIVETALAKAVAEHTPVSASAIIVEPRTGRILAMATLPNFDPNDPGKVPLADLRNRVIADCHEPGSTFKVVSVSAALNEGVVRLQDQFDCGYGRFPFGGQILHDHERFGRLTVEDIIARSSNIGAAQIGIRLGPARLYAYIRRFGFGDLTGIRLPGEIVGIVHPLNHWSKVSIARIPMGQGISVTPLQMVMAVSAVANRGRLMTPLLVDRLEDGQGRAVAKTYPVMVRRVVSPAAARQMVEAMKRVVSTNGTAPKARLDDYTVAGKTGTAQAPIPGGYSHVKFFASFIGFFPADAPQLCIGVMLDEPQHGYYGGQVAAPVFKEIAELAANYLNIPPNAPLDQTIAPSRVGTRLTASASD
jgi:cell division protein FtsI (penicillin-binding protein 3)